MNTEAFREIQSNENELILKLLAAPFPGRDELSQQLKSAKVRTIDENGSFEFSIESCIRATHIKYAVPTEGEFEDLDGVTVHVLLHVRSGEMKELEVFREDNSRVQKWPELGSVRVLAPD